MGAGGSQLYLLTFMGAALSGLFLFCGFEARTQRGIPHDTATDFPVRAEKDSLGDILAFSNPLYDESNTNNVGTSNGVCFRTAVGSTYECFWTATLPEGQLTVQGPFFDKKDSTLAITGGTGDYDQARGQMAVHARNAAGTEYDFTYTIVK